MIECILFDYDGTIADTAEIVEKGFKETVKKFTGHDITRNEFINLFGRPLPEMMSSFDKVDTDDMIAYYREYFSKYQDMYIKPFPGVVETVERLKTLKVMMGVVSSRTKTGVEYGLDKFGIRNYIDLVIGLEDTINNKPHPEPIYKAMELLNVTPHQTMMVGDSPHDILAAKASGVKSCAVNWSIFDSMELRELNPDYMISDISELIKIIIE